RGARQARGWQSVSAPRGGALSRDRRELHGELDARGPGRAAGPRRCAPRGGARGAVEMKLCVGFVPRGEPLEPGAAAATGHVAKRLGERLLAMDEERL